MFSNFTPFDILIFIIGSVVLLKKVADMDRHETLRAVVLTTILGALVSYFFLFTLSPDQSSTCGLEFDSTWSGHE